MHRSIRWQPFRQRSASVSSGSRILVANIVIDLALRLSNSPTSPWIRPCLISEIGQSSYPATSVTVIMLEARPWEMPKTGWQSSQLSWQLGPTGLPTRQAKGVSILPMKMAWASPRGDKEKIDQLKKGDIGSKIEIFLEILLKYGITYI